MSNATSRNFAAGQGERNRRLARMLEGGMPLGSLAVEGDPAWQSFWGSMHDKEAEANAAGQGFRADLGGIGRAPKFSGGVSEWSDPPQAGDAGGLTPREQASIGANLGLGQLTDMRRARALAEQRANIGDMQQSYDEHVLNSVMQPKEEASITTEFVGPDGRAFTMRQVRDPNDTRSARQKALERMPGAARMAMEAAIAPLEQKDRQLAETERSNKASEAVMGAAVMSPDAIEDAARNYLTTGMMPTLGQKDPGNRARITTRAAELARADGGEGANIAANKANFRADSGSLASLQKQRDAVGAFEETALKNLDVFLDAAKKVPDLGSPMLNKPIRAISEQGLGSAELAAFNAARRTVIPEFAKILANPGLSGQLSDSARHEVEEVLSGNATLAQTLAVADVLKRDAANRRTSYDDQLKTIKGRLSGGGKTGDKPAAGGQTYYREKYDY